MSNVNLPMKFRINYKYSFSWIEKKKNKLFKYDYSIWIKFDNLITLKYGRNFEFFNSFSNFIDITCPSMLINYK